MKEVLKEGYITDFISGLPVRETPEEIEAVQPFSKILVDDYGYPKDHVHTRPQYHVKARPSDTKKEYPVDIAVFTGPEHTEDNIHIIVECKRKTEKTEEANWKIICAFLKHTSVFGLMVRNVCI